MYNILNKGPLIKFKKATIRSEIKYIIIQTLKYLFKCSNIQIINFLSKKKNF